MPLTYFQPSQVDSTFNGYLRNRIINGAMMIDQRNAGASITPSANAYTVDRWYATFGGSATSKMSFQQSSVVPPGFVNSMLATVVSAYSVGSSDSINFNQRIEGLNVADLAWGTASASPITVSFWVRSSVNGVYGAAIKNSAADRGYPFTYTINSANAWEYKTVTIPGDTTGTWLTSNGIGLVLNFSLANGGSTAGTAGAWAASNLNSATGATNIVATNGATWYVTGVQLEVGSVATPFERRMYPQELQFAQRYYSKSYPQSVVPGTATSDGRYLGVSVAGAGFVNFDFPVEMRVSPTITPYSTNGASGVYGSDTSGNWAPVASSISTRRYSSYGSLANNQFYYGHYVASAEL